MKHSPISAPTALAGSIAFALAAALSAPAAAQSAKAELTIDVATHTAPGMAGGGLIGRLASRSVARPHYGMTRYPGLPGRYLDVALYNPTKPGVPAQQAIPKGLKLGSQLDLLPPERKQAASAVIADGSNPALADGGTYRVRYYWGCSQHAGKGQPLEYSMTVRNGKPVQTGRAMKPRFTPDHIDVDRGYVLWPNQANSDNVSSRASLVGGHRVTGERLPDPMQFELAAAQDFMAELEPTTEGNTSDGLVLHWNGVDGAQAYFAHATVADGDGDGETIVMWSSSEDGYAGPEMLDYLPQSKVGQWTGKRTLMGAGTRECQVPVEVFAGGGMPMLQMTAHGSERSIPGNGWTARVRNKSSAMLMLSASGEAPSTGNSAKEAAKGALRGLFGR